MLGQEKLLEKINNYTIDTLPHSILLVGQRGDPYLELCEYISNKFNLPLFDITETISDDYINEIYQSPNLGLYVVNTVNITVREQNILLKFFEEPNRFTYIILLCESASDLLPTIISRSFEFDFEKYSYYQLEPLAKEKDLTLKVCSTPGQIEIANSTDMVSLYNLCKTILDKMSRAAYFNALTISDKINFKDEYEKYDLYLFIKMLSYVMLNGSDVKSYFLLKNFNRKIWPLVNKKQQFENFITELWLLKHGN